MTEEQIERMAERDMDKLDNLLMRGVYTQEEYDREVKELDAWVQHQYRIRHAQ